MRVLFIEDDTSLCSAVTFELDIAGFLVDTCHSGDEGLRLLQSGYYDVCVLDRMLPVLDGIAVLKKARSSGVTTPVLMLTALAEINDRVIGLQAGADDYLPKPFDMRELSARLIALSRRLQPPAQDGVITCGNTSLNLSEQYLKGPLSQTDLSKTECELLEALFKAYGKLLNRELLLGRVWGAQAMVESASLDSYIHFVRRRLKSVGANLKITTVRGTGYRLEDENA